jgi:hypothetical protein
VPDLWTRVTIAHGQLSNDNPTASTIVNFVKNPNNLTGFSPYGNFFSLLFYPGLIYMGTGIAGKDEREANPE